MRLVAVAQLEGECGVAGRAACRQTLRRFVKSIALNHPLGADADILCEQSLQRSLVQSEPVDEIVDLQDAAVFRCSVNNRLDVADVLVRLRVTLAQETLDDLDTRQIRGGREDCTLQRVAFSPENVPKHHRRVGEPRHRAARKRMKSSGRELHRKYTASTLEQPRQL